MDHETCLDFQRIQVTEDESLDTYNNIMAQLQLDRRFPEGRRSCERLLEDLGLQPAREDQEDRTCKQFVFQGQCLVLGESGVGKTSLVKSLTGKPFNIEQSKTQGIDQSLVNEKWQNLDPQDLLFGNFSRFFTTVLVQLTVFGKAGNVIVQESTVLPSNVPQQDVVLLIFGLLCCLQVYVLQPVPFLLLCTFIALTIVVSWCIFRSESTRLVAIAFSFIADYPGLFIGALLSILSEGYFNETPADCRSVITLLILVFLLSSFALFFYLYTVSRSFQQSFGINRKCWFPGQLKFKNQRRVHVEIIFISRLLITFIIGYTCFATLMIFNLIETNALTLAVVLYCEISLLLQSVPQIPEWRRIVITSLAYSFFWFVRILVPLYVYCMIAFFITCCFTAYKEYFCITSAVATFGNDYESTSNFTAVCIEKAAINQRNLRNALNKKFSSLKLKILDFAGDKEYHAYHHMFLRSRAIYVIVFNMAEFAENSFKGIHAKIKTLHLWFESICSHVPLKTPILLVGTHRGNMNKIWMEELNGHLKRNLWHLYCDEIVENDVDKLIFFPVENSQSQSDPGVQTLQKKIMSVAEEYKGTIGSDIPLSWIQIQDEIISLKANEKAKFCVTIEEFPTAIGTFICTNWSEETLKYFHEKGLVIYLDKDPELSKWVLLKPEILVDIIIQLVTPPPQMIQERGFRRDWELLHDKGSLTKSLLTRIISTVQENEEAMTAFLEEYDLICPLSNNKVKMRSLYDDEEHQPTHFVPSLLPMSTNGSIPTWLENTTDKKFYVLFNRFLPEPLFHRLLSRAHKNSKLEFPNGPVVMFKDVAKFWMSPWQPYRLKLMKEEAIIEVTFSSR